MTTPTRTTPPTAAPIAIGSVEEVEALDDDGGVSVEDDDVSGEEIKRADECSCEKGGT